MKRLDYVNTSLFLCVLIMLIFKTGIFYWWIVVLVIILDQLSKYLVVANLDYQSIYNIFPWFAITHVYNKGAAFSFLADQSGWQSYFFISIALVSFFVILWMMYKSSRDKIWLNASLALIAGGAVGNLIDRIVHNYVIDFILVYVKGVFTYPAFNIADSAVCVGATILVIISFKKDKVDQTNKGSPQNV